MSIPRHPLFYLIDYQCITKEKAEHFFGIFFVVNKKKTKKVCR